MQRYTTQISRKLSVTGVLSIMAGIGLLSYIIFCRNNPEFPRTVHVANSMPDTLYNSSRIPDVIER